MSDKEQPVKGESSKRSQSGSSNIINLSLKKKKDRKQLDGQTCKLCEEYYGDKLTPEQLQERLNKCSRHRDPDKRQLSPEHFWEVDFPTTEECVQRGTLLVDKTPVKRTPKKKSFITK